MSLQFGKGGNQLDCGLTTDFDAANHSLLQQSIRFCSLFVAGNLLMRGSGISIESLEFASEFGATIAVS